MIGLALAAAPFAAYTYDVYVRPQRVAREARAFADSLGKPLLNVGAGTPRSSARVAVFGDTAWGDVNTDLTGTGVPRLGNPQHVYHLDIQQRFPFSDKVFGAVIASHCLEQVEDPVFALEEMRRVADRVFVICTRWWDLPAWMHPDQKWCLSRQGRFVRVDGRRGSL
jgi:ubiquinone/menaquinone biosynthesis C-methylase UbiE